MKTTWMLLLLAVLTLAWIALSKPTHPPHPHPKPTPTPSPTPTPTPIPHVTLSWDTVAPTTDPATNPTGYEVDMGFASGAETLPTDVGNVLVWTVQLSPATTYFFVVKAYNAAGTRSLPSNEITVTTPP